MSNRSTCVVVLAGMCLALPALGVGLEDEADLPDEAFTVFVVSEMEDEAAEDYSPEKVKKEVEKRIKKNRRWFVVAKSPEKAELFVNVVRHTVDEQMRHKMVARVNVSGNGKDWVTETWAQEQHFLQVRVDYFGKQKLVEGEDVRENGGTLKRAAENLTTNLEAFCREHYEELSRLRRAIP